jgi:pimeloyl-ACP methyl ester carboxylesterase
MRESETWSIPGAEGLPIHANTHEPEGRARAVAICIHGYTGHKDRGVTPAVAAFLGGEARVLTHRVTLSHAGVDKDGDDITRPDEFERDSNDFCVFDVRAVVRAIDAGVIPGKGLALILVGHSRGGATVYRCAAQAEAEPWPIRPAAVISLAATATFTRLTNDMRRQLDERGYVERECSRGPGGSVRLGRSWYQHHLDEPERDHFAEAIAGVRCPVLIAHATEDDSVPMSHAETIRAMFAEHNPGVTPRVALIPDGDHNFNVSGYRPGPGNADNPVARRLYEAVGGFLDGVIGG